MACYQVTAMDGYLLASRLKLVLVVSSVAGCTDATESSYGRAASGPKSTSPSPSVPISLPSLDSETVPHEPGQRMKPLVFRAGDAEVSTQYWWDAELGALCFLFPDGRCHPLGNNEIVFTDSACTQPVIMQTDGACYDAAEWRRPRAVEQSGSADCEVIAVNVAGAEEQAPTTIYGGGVGACFQDEAPATARFFAVGPDASLGRMTASVEPMVPGLDARMLRGPDGSRVVVDFYDPVHAWSCWTSADLEPTDACWPRAATRSASSSFVDPGCMMPAISYIEGACAQPAEALITVEETQQECEKRAAQVHELEGPLEAQLYQSDASGCVPAGTAVQSTLVRGASVDPSTLPVIETLAIGTGRLKALYEGYQGVPYKPAESRAFLDSETQQRCWGWWLDNGVTACVPETFKRVVFSGYVSDTCTGDEVHYLRRASRCDPVEGVLVPTLDCALKVQAFSATPFTGTAIHALDTDGVCTAQDITQPSVNEYYVLGDPIDPSQFPPLDFEILE